MLRLLPKSTPPIGCARGDNPQFVLLLYLLDVLQLEENQTVSRNELSSHARYSVGLTLLILGSEMIAKPHVFQVSFLRNDIEVCGDRVYLM